MAQNRYFEADGLRFSINPDGKSVTLSRLIDENTQKVVIPSTVNNYPVTTIGDWAFSGCSDLKNVTIPDSVTEISSYAFNDCTGLTSVTIGNSVTSIGNSAFSKCTGLTSVTIGNSVTSIGDAAFFRCTGLTGISIPDSVTTIGDGAFVGCTGLTSVNIPNSVTTIGDDAFESTACFDNQPDGLVYAGLVAYKYKGRMPSGTSIVIKDGAKGIAGGAFEGCTGLTNVTIPDTVTAIGDEAFSGCTGLTSIQVVSGNPIYDSRDNCNAIIETSTDTLISGCQSTTIPDSVSAIGKYAFYGCTGLKSITIPDSVTGIGDWAFSGCTGLTNVTIPDSVWSACSSSDVPYNKSMRCIAM